MRRLKDVPFRYWILSIFIYLLSIVLNIYHVFGEQSDLGWYICLIPSLIFSYYFGLTGGIFTAVITLILHVLYDFYNSLNLAEFVAHLFSGTFFQVVIFNFIFSIGIGYLADKLKMRQSELEKLNLELIDKTKALKEAESKYRSLVEEALIGVYMYQDGKLTYVNPRFAEIFGYTSEEILDMNFLDLCHEDDRSILMNNIQKRLANQLLLPYQLRGIQKDKRIIEVELHGSLTNFNGRPAIIGTMLDITDRKRTEELLRKSDKLSIVGQLAAGVAHEIRNPLTSLRGFLQLLQKRSKEKDEYFGIMLSELERINTIVTEFLFLAKPQEPNFEKKDIKILLRDVLTLIKTQAIMNDVQISTEFDLDISFITCEEKQIKQVLINILKNAIEAMPDGGDILIQVSANTYNTILIRVVDNGSGMPEGRISKLGEPFFTTKEKGTGLGLMVSFKIIEAHQGEISYKSEPGKGTIVDVILPVSQSEKVKTRLSAG